MDQNPSMSSPVATVAFAPSRIHGTGGFATVDFIKGTRVIEYAGERIDKTESINRCETGNQCIFHLDEQMDLDGNVSWNPARFLNHSCSPNCDAELIEGRIWIVARRDIAVGEELTFNYSYDLTDFREHPCRCGSSACAGFIVAEDLFDHVRGRWKPPPIQLVPLKSETSRQTPTQR